MIIVSILVPPRWISISLPTCIEAGDVSGIFMLWFAGEAVDEGDGSRLRLSEGLCLSMIRTKNWLAGSV